MQSFFHCRDVPLAALISLLLIAAVYTLANLAYFTALSPAEVLQSPAVALVSTLLTSKTPIL